MTTLHKADKIARRLWKMEEDQECHKIKLLPELLSSGSEVEDENNEKETDELSDDEMDNVRKLQNPGEGTTTMVSTQGGKPTQSYIALIATAILQSETKRLVLSDIYKYIMGNYPYFQNQDKSWRNSIRHNLSLNECFIKVGRSEHGKGHYWAIHPANYEDFSMGDFRRRRARRRVRKSFFDNYMYQGYNRMIPYPSQRPYYEPDFMSVTSQHGVHRDAFYPILRDHRYYTRRFIRLPELEKRASNMMEAKLETMDSSSNNKNTQIATEANKKSKLFTIENILNLKTPTSKESGKPENEKKKINLKYQRNNEYCSCDSCEYRAKSILPCRRVGEKRIFVY